MTHALERDRTGYILAADDGWLRGVSCRRKGSEARSSRRLCRKFRKRLGVEDTEDQDSPKQLDIEGNVRAMNANDRSLTVANDESLCRTDRFRHKSVLLLSLPL